MVTATLYVSYWGGSIVLVFWFWKQQQIIAFENDSIQSVELVIWCQKKNVCQSLENKTQQPDLSEI